MFTQNMTMAMVAEMDRRRGQGDQSTFNNPDGIVRKRPWLNPDGTHKSAEREDEMQNDKNPLEKSIENLKKFVMSSAHAPSGASAPHGSVTGVSSAGGHSGMMSPNASAALGAVKPPAGPKPMGAKPPPLPSLKSFSDKERCGDGVAEMIEGMGAAKKSDGAAEHAARADAAQRESARRFGKRERDIRAHQMSTDTRKSLSSGQWEEAAKSLNSRSMHVMRPLGQYDPYQIARSATTVPMGQIAPPELEAKVRPAPVYKSCTIHGLMHKSDVGCHLCSVQKSMTCKCCGAQLVKMRGNGGEPSCPSGH